MAKKPEVKPVDPTIAKAKEQQKQAEKLRASELRYQEGDTGLPISDLVMAESNTVFAHNAPQHSNHQQQVVKNTETHAAPHQGLDIMPPVAPHHPHHVSHAKPIFTGKVVANNEHAQQFVATRVGSTHGIVDVASTGALNIFGTPGILASGGGIFMARQVVDGHEINHPITFTTGTTGAVVISGDSAVVLTEDVDVKAGDLVASGALVDETEGPSAFQAYQHDGKYGHLSMDSHGQWFYHADDHQTAIQSLKPGESITDTFTVATNSGIDSSVTVVIKGAEDKAIIAGVHTGDVTEDVQVQDGKLNTEGQLIITDNDHDDAYFIPQAISTNHGEFTLDNQGHWHFTANNADPAIQQLAAGETFTQTFTAVSKDGGTTQEVVVTVHGTNDLPVLTVTQNSTKSGQLHTTDIDATDTHIYGVVGGSAVGKTVVAHGVYGDLTLDSITGEYGYKIHTDAIQNGHGMNYDPKTHTYSGQDSFEISTTDNHGGSATQHLTFFPTATLTVPTISGAKPSIHYSVPTQTQISPVPPMTPMKTPAQPTVTIDGLDPTTDSGKDNTDGITNNQNPTVTGVAGVPFSLVSIVDGKNVDGTDKIVGSGYADVNGHYQIVVGLGQSPTNSGTHHDLTATVTDPSGQDGSTTASTPILIDQHTTQPTVDLNATSDSFGGTGTNTDNITNIANPTLTLGNIDTDAQQVEVFVDGHSIGNAVSQNGVWQITVPKSFMDEGDHDITATVTDIAGNTSTSNALTVTIDQHVVAPDATDTVTEDSKVTATGDVNPHGEVGDVVTVINTDGKHGHFDVNADGTYTYTLDNKAAQHLAQGESETDSVKYTVTDTAGNTNTGEITVTIHGSNDVPDLHITQSTNTTGTLSTIDVDTTDTHTYDAVGGTTTGSSVVAHGIFGDLTLDNATGVYSYTMHADAIHQGMNYDANSGKYTGQDTFEVSTDDHHGGKDSQFLTFNPTATVMAPSVVGQQPTVTNNVPTQAQLTLMAPIAPAITLTTPTVTLTGLTGSTDTGIDNTDGITSNPTPSITGSTDIPFSQVDIIDGKNADGSDHIVGSGFSDGNGDFEIAIDLGKSSKVDGTHHDLGAKVTDPSGHDGQTTATTAIVIDQNVAAPDATDTVTEDTNVIATGDVNPQGEVGDVVTVIDADGKHGHFDVKADGTYTYTLDNNAAQHLAQGESETDSVKYTVTDTAGNTSTGEITVTIHGSNDIPSLQIAQSANTTGTLSTIDVDTTDTHTYDAVGGTTTGSSVVAHGTFGDLTLDNATGVYSYTMHADAIHQGMNYDANSGKYTGQDTFEVSTDDHHGGKDSQFLTFNPTATVMAASVVGQQPTVTNNVPTQAQLTPMAPIAPAITLTTPTVTLTGLTGNTDTGIDHTDGITSNPTPSITGTTDIPFSQVDIIDGKNADGSDHIVGSGFSDGNGKFEIVVDLGKSSSVDGTHHDLGAKVTDPSGHDGQTTATTAIVIDQNVAAPDATDTVTEDTNVIATGDVNPQGEAGDVVTIIDADGKHGHFDVKADGTYTYTLDNKAAQHLAQGESETDSVKYTVTDMAGNTSTGEITVTIHGSNDVPELHITQSTNTTGTLSTIDVDTTDTHTYDAVGGTTTGSSVVAHGTFGDLTLDNATGVYSYTMHADAIHQGMNYDTNSGKYTGQDTFEVSTDDHHGGKDSQFLTFNPTATVTAASVVGQQPTVTNNVPTQAQLTPMAPIAPAITLTTPTVTLTGLTGNTDTGIDHTDGITSNSTPSITGSTDIPFSQVDIIDGKNADGSDHIVGSGFSDVNGKFEIVVDLGKSSSVDG
ncbi:VCBS domain-containing protein, partial [Vibrio halioticoli]